VPLVLSPAVPEAVVTAPAAASLIPTNAHNVNYFDSNQQVTCARLCMCSHGNHCTVAQKAKNVYDSFDNVFVRGKK
jgi:hypothetical protein